MKQNTRYILTATAIETSFIFDTFCETFGTAMTAVPAYNGIFCSVTGRKSSKITLTGTLAMEQLSDYEALKTVTGRKTTFVINSVQYENYALESVKAEFEAGSLLGTVTAVITEVT